MFRAKHCKTIFDLEQNTVKNYQIYVERDTVKIVRLAEEHCPADKNAKNIKFRVKRWKKWQMDKLSRDTCQIKYGTLYKILD